MKPSRLPTLPLRTRVALALQTLLIRFCGF